MTLDLHIYKSEPFLPNITEFCYNFIIRYIWITNNIDDMDKAYVRRFSFKVKYDFLTPDQVITAFKDFFNQIISKDEIVDLTNLTPGDFVVIKKQADLLDITDKSELLSKLRQEQLVKNLHHKRTKIGF